ncbi:MAG: PhzF family phenazine biosynthesis protein [Candidatus Thorarchaeota archaeon]|nr:MAG: PhzF family phenazine biosynthesis protein [Candidatus Thorarchaeota archaeon]
MKQKHSLDIIQVDAFTDTPFGGNPAAVVLAADHVSDETMHKIAREMNVRETVFISKSRVADFRFRYMTPKSEIDFSGHPTIAAFHALVEIGRIDLLQDVTMTRLETNTGVLDIDIVRNESTGHHEIQITHKTPRFLDTYDPKDYAEALGLSLADIHSPNPLQTVSTGTPHLMIPVSTQRSLDRIKPNWDRLKELQTDSDYVSLSVFTRDTREPTSDAQVRHFGPAVGVYEDPVSGSAAGSLGSYIIRYGFMETPFPVTSIVIEQGHYVDRPGKIFVEVRGDQEGIDQVKVSGTGVTVLKGTIHF